MSLLAASCIADLCLATKHMGSSSEEPNLSLKLPSETRQSTRFLSTSAATVATFVMVFQHSSMGNEITLFPEEDIRFWIRYSQSCSLVQCNSLLTGLDGQLLLERYLRNQVDEAIDRWNRTELQALNNMSRDIVIKDELNQRFDPEYTLR